jgi:hypothetical protein
MREHIEGKLTLEENIVFALLGEGGELIAQCMPHRKEEAWRLMVCWNACEGLNTESLENILMTGETLKSRFELLKQEIGETK